MAQSIVFVNASTVVSAGDLAACVAALQKQVDSDFVPIYGAPATLSIAMNYSASDWPVIVGDDSDQLDALGYHELGASGQPMGKVFAKSTMDDGGKWTVTASHELLEMLVDPWACLMAQGADNQVRAYEVCDAVEDDPFGYEIDGVTVSDFVFPAWFDGSPGPYDLKGHATAPGQILENGYIGIFTNGQWTQQTEARAAEILRAPRQLILPGSRRSKRRSGQQSWRRSAT